ncbi:ATP-binding protein [Streptomyces sp. NPDC092952]|uniref:ATP-binding protein n=1 Tax=Streptomyces sp. NPDC092952 TaxID=3366018 RepID=UPI0037F7BE68
MRAFLRKDKAIPEARTFVGDTLDQWGLPLTARRDDILLCVSELATNAVRHATAGQRFLVRIREDGELLRIEVLDKSRRRPRVRTPNSDESSGRGLLLVDAFADLWGGSTRSPLAARLCGPKSASPAPRPSRSREGGRADDHRPLAAGSRGGIARPDQRLDMARFHVGR